VSAAEPLAGIGIRARFGKHDAGLPQQIGE
jgi:hypothetical protein